MMSYTCRVNLQQVTQAHHESPAACQKRLRQSSEIVNFNRFIGEDFKSFKRLLRDPQSK